MKRSCEEVCLEAIPKNSERLHIMVHCLLSATFTHY